MTTLAPSLKAAMHSALVQQAIIIVLAGMILDGGALFQICFYAVAGFWGGVGIMVFRRAATPTKLDVALVQGGYLLVCLISFFLTQIIWQLRGY